MNAKRSTIVDLTDRQSERQERILDAAKTCFVRTGFDRTTMQDIAREAAMSSPNIYRYFESKEALVLGLAERDGQQRSAFILEPLAKPGAGIDALVEVFERYFAGLDRESAILSVDLWLNATRHPGIADIEARGDRTSREWLIQTFTSLATSPDCDPTALVDAISPLFRGMIVSRALKPGWDPAPAFAQLRALIQDGLGGRLQNQANRKET